MEERTAECPLGAKCEEVKQENGKPVLYRCPWHVKVRGTDINTGEELDHWQCAIAWMPTLMINAANESRKGVAATESFRNEVMKTQQDREALERLRAIRMMDIGQLEDDS
jgi:hypothetical protein